MAGDLNKRIQERAYEIWQNEGRPEGRSHEHWDQARGEFADAQSEAGTGKAKGAARKGASASSGTKSGEAAKRKDSGSEQAVPAAGLTTTAPGQPTGGEMGKSAGASASKAKAGVSATRAGAKGRTPKSKG